jgi:hypothetical protein
MNRRRVLQATAFFPFLLPAVVRAQGMNPFSATPVPIGDWFSVTWWTIDNEDPDHPIFMGDVQNTSDATLDAPVVGITAYGEGGNILGSSYAIPEPPVLAPGERAYIYGHAPKDLPDNGVIELFYCDDLSGATYYTDKSAALSLVLSEVEEERGDGSFHAEGNVQNSGTSPAETVGVVAIFSNPDGRVVGTLSTNLDRAVPAGKFMRWTIDHGNRMFHSFHPFTSQLNADYTVTYWCGYLSNARAISC